MTPIRITLELTPTGRYRAMLGDKLLVTSREPFYSAARVLLAEGLDPETVLEAQHAGSPIVAMRASLREAARYTVEESSRDGCRLVPWTEERHGQRLARQRSEYHSSATDQPAGGSSGPESP
jgi:hypothetical protein